MDGGSAASEPLLLSSQEEEDIRIARTLHESLQGSSKTRAEAIMVKEDTTVIGEEEKKVAVADIERWKNYTNDWIRFRYFRFAECNPDSGLFQKVRVKIRGQEEFSAEKESSDN